MENIANLLRKYSGAGDLASQSPEEQFPLPNGGMDDQTLQDFLATNPSPVATTGENPNANDGTRLLASEDPTLSPNGPSLFDRNTNTLKSQMAEGNVGPDVRTDIPSGPGGSSPTAPKTASSPKSPLLNMLQPQQSPVDTGYGNDLNDAALKLAQERQSKNNFNTNLGRAANQILGGFTNTKPSNEIYDKLDEESGMGVKNILTRREAKDADIKHAMSSYLLADEKEKNNPNSAASKIAQQVMQKASDLIGMKFNVEGLSAASIEKQFGPITKFAELLEGQKNRKEVAEQTKLLKEAAAKEKSIDNNNKQFVKMGQDIDPNKARAGATSKVQQTLNAAEKLEGLLKQFPDGNVPKNQTRELATAVASMLGGGASGAAVSQINELVPHSIMGDSMAMASWFTNKPMGQQQQNFINLLADTIQREKGIAEQQIKRDTLSRAGSWNHLKKADEQTFYDQLANKGISREDYDSFKSGKKIDVVNGGFKDNKKDSKIEDYAKQYKIDYDHAAQILKARGYGG